MMFGLLRNEIAAGKLLIIKYRCAEAATSKFRKNFVVHLRQPILSVIPCHATCALDVFGPGDVASLGLVWCTAFPDPVIHWLLA